MTPASAAEGGVDATTAARVARPHAERNGSAAGGAPAYAFAGHRLAVGPRELSRAGRVLEVPSRVFDCLVYLVEHRDRAIGRDELVAAVWGRVDVSDAQLGQIVLRARRVVGDDGHEQRLIRTMPKFGYRWIAPVEVLDTALATPRAEAAPAAADLAAPPSRPSRRPGGRRVPAFLFAGIAVVAAWTLARSREDAIASVVAGEPVAVVLPVEVARTEDGEWIRLGGMDVLGARLRAGGLHVAESERVLASLAGESGEHAEARLRRSGAAMYIVRAKLAATARGWHAEVSATLGDGTIVEADSAGAEPLPALRQAGDRLLAQIADPGTRVAAVGSGAMPGGG